VGAHAVARDAARGVGSAGFRTGAVILCRRWGVAAWSNSGPARRAPRRSLKTIPSFSCEIVFRTSIADNRRFLVLKSVSCSSSTAGNTRSPRAGGVQENTGNPN
jgi:hypothetical protein